MLRKKLQLRYDLKKIKEKTKFNDHLNVLNDYFDREYFFGDNKFIIEPKHLGDLSKLYKLWEVYGCDEGIEMHLNSDNLSFTPDKQILKYIFINLLKQMLIYLLMLQLIM